MDSQANTPTESQLQDAVAAHKIDFWPMRRCGICEEFFGFIFRDGQPFWDSTCGCTQFSSPRPRAWTDVAAAYQSDSKAAEFWADKLPAASPILIDQDAAAVGIQQVLEKWVGVRPDELDDDAVPLFLQELAQAGLQLAPVLHPAEQAQADLAKFVQQAYAYKSTFPGLPEGYTHDDIDRLYQWADGADDLLRTAPKLLTAPASAPVVIQEVGPGGWVPVGERLPEAHKRQPYHWLTTYESDRVLAYEKGEEKPDLYYCNEKGQWRQCGLEFHGHYAEVTHWQPLPAAPTA